jgi:glycosyltransferase involved in cell wall biosynthesis
VTETGGRAPLRVLFVNENIGGHATVHHHMGHGFADHDIISATFIDVPPRGLVRRLAGAPVPGLDRLDLDLQPLRAQLAAAAWVRRALKAHHEPYDVLHVYTQNAALLSSDLLRSVPTVVSLDTTNARNAYRLPYRAPTRFTPATVACSKPFERRVFDAATTVVANSRWAAGSLIDDYGLAPSEVRVIPFGIRGPDAAPRRDHRIGRPRVGFVGRQFAAKGGVALLEAFDRYLRGRAELLLVTEEPVEPAEGITVVADLRQGDRRLWELLESCDIFAFPSTIDQAPNAVLEAMAAGLPVVAVDTAAVGEMVVDGGTGILIGSDDPDALGRALSELVDNGDKRRMMGHAGRRRFEQVYDLDIGLEALAATLVQAGERWQDNR